MPYEGELASKASHVDILKNPDVRDFLAECAFLTPPSDEEIQSLIERFVEPPSLENAKLPAFVIAVDGSQHESSIDDKLPSTKIGYIKVGSVLIDMDQFGSLREGRYVDPFKVARLRDSNTALTFTIPSANIRWHGKNTVTQSFRASLDQQLYHEKTRFTKHDPSTSLRSTLFILASRRPDEKLHTGDHRKLKLHTCPTCKEGPVTLQDIPDQQYCEFCHAEIYPSDCLRLWEEVSEYQSNQMVINRVTSVLEHLIPFHYMRYLLKHAPLLLSSTAFFVDGPLAIFGPTAWLHRAMLVFLHELNQHLQNKLHQSPMLIIGLQKTGQVVDHVTMIERFLPNNRLYPIDDEYRYKYIKGGEPMAKNGFGEEAYYGQDFIYKTPTGRNFVFALPYPVKVKSGQSFIHDKTRLDWYPQLTNALKLITHFESDLYKNAVVPIALAHHYTAISLRPGGQLLDLLTKKAIK